MVKPIVCGRCKAKALVLKSNGSFQCFQCDYEPGFKIDLSTWNRPRLVGPLMLPALRPLKEIGKYRKAKFLFQDLRQRAKLYMRLMVENGDVKPVCVHCGSNDELTVDHILPLSKGGLNNRANLQLLCLSCHRVKDGLVPKPKNPL